MFFFITRPLYDLVTHYLYHWSTVIVEEAKRRKIDVIDLEKEKVTRKRTESYLHKQHPSIVMFNGHGNDVCVAGQEGEPLLQAGENSHLLKGTVVYMRACSSGKVLGPEAVHNGAKAFIGYTELFRFWTGKESVAHPLQDEYAAPFFETSNQVALSLLKGKTAQEAHQDALKAYQKVMSQLLTSQAENSFVVADLFWNMQHQICLEK